MRALSIGVGAALVLAAGIAAAGHGGAGAHPVRERAVARVWCEAHGGQVEVRLADGRRVDCLTDTHAVEVERAGKWAESIGQALGYAGETDRRAGVVLLIEGPDGETGWERLRAVVERWALPVDLWRVP